MLKKQIALPLVLLIGLAGCGNRKKQKKSHTVDTTAAINLPKSDSRSVGTVAENDILSFFDEDLDAYALDNDEVTIATADDSATAWVSDNDQGAISWIEQAQEDNGLQTIYFGFNKYGITQDQRAVVDADAEAVKQILSKLDADSTIVIEGHACSSAGSRDYNVHLSEKRAKYISDLLKLHGVDNSRIKIVGRGQEMPAIVNGKAISGSRDEQWPNRRVEIRVVETV